MCTNPNPDLTSTYMSMEQTINMAQGASKETSRQEKLINGTNKFFGSTAKKIVPTK